MTASSHGQSSPECQTWLDNFPPGPVYIEDPTQQDPVGCGYIIGNRVAWTSPVTDILSFDPPQIEFEATSPNRTCEDITVEVRRDVELMRGWTLSGSITISGSAEAEAGVIFARATATAGFALQLGGGFNGSTTETYSYSESTVIKPCQTKRVRIVTRTRRGVAEADYEDARVYIQSTFGTCAELDTLTTGVDGIHSHCGRTTFRAEIEGDVIDNTLLEGGFTVLDPPQNCANCDDDDGDGGDDGSGGGDGPGGPGGPGSGPGGLPCPTDPRDDMYWMGFDPGEPGTVPPIGIGASDGLVDDWGPCDHDWVDWYIDENTPILLVDVN